MDSISPLARVLAEANGIDWRSLHGSGEGGAVVEQDILNYLTRVMSGDEEPPASPVDEPPPDWTGEMPPLPMLGAAGLEALSAAGVESDITEFMARQSAPAPPLPRQEPADDLGDGLEFELDDAPAPASAFPAPGFSAPDDFELSDDRGEELPDLRAGNLGDPQPSGVPTWPESRVGLESGVGMVVHPQPGTLEGILPGPPSASELAHSLPPAGIQPPEAPAAPFQAAGIQQAPESRMPESQIPPPPPSAPPEAPRGAFGLGSLLSRLYHRDPPAAASVPPAVAPELDLPEPVGPVPTLTEPPAPVFPAASRTIPETEPVLGEALTPQAPPIPDTPVAAPLVADQLRDQPGPAAAPLASPVPISASPVPGRPVGGPPLLTLRLNLDLSALISAQGQLAEVLGQEVPLPLLVARAAARSLEGLGLHTVALAGADGRTLGADPGGDFRQSVAALASGAGGGAAELLVLDAAALELDELHLDGLDGVRATLSLGRAGDGRSSLSLRSDADARSGAAFLHAVAALLGAPVGLLL